MTCRRLWNCWMPCGGRRCLPRQCWLCCVDCDEGKSVPYVGDMSILMMVSFRSLESAEQTQTGVRYKEPKSRARANGSSINDSD